MIDDDSFQFEVAAYDQNTVIRLLTNYLDIRMALLDRMPNPSKPLYSNNVKQVFREKPRGASTSTPWPFMTKARAAVYVDGKKRARMMEDLHVASLDLEIALNRLDDDEYQLVSDYYIFGNGTIEQLAQARGLASKGRLQERIQRIVKKLVRTMNNGEQPNG